eukprot:Clim_evm31s238 gene=Clim_evmTU31s238
MGQTLTLHSHATEDCGVEVQRYSIIRKGRKTADFKFSKTHSKLRTDKIPSFKGAELFASQGDVKASARTESIPSALRSLRRRTSMELLRQPPTQEPTSVATPDSPIRSEGSDTDTQIRESFARAAETQFATVNGNVQSMTISAREVPFQGKIRISFKGNTPLPQSLTWINAFTFCIDEAKKGAFPEPLPNGHMPTEYLEQLGCIFQVQYLGSTSKYIDTEKVKEDTVAAGSEESTGRKSLVALQVERKPSGSDSVADIVSDEWFMPDDVMNGGGQDFINFIYLVDENGRVLMHSAILVIMEGRTTHHHRKQNQMAHHNNVLSMFRRSCKEHSTTSEEDTGSEKSDRSHRSRSVTIQSDKSDESFCSAKSGSLLRRLSSGDKHKRARNNTVPQVKEVRSSSASVGRSSTMESAPEVDRDNILSYELRKPCGKVLVDVDLKLSLRELYDDFFASTPAKLREFYLSLGCRDFHTHWWAHGQRSIFYMFPDNTNGYMQTARTVPVQEQQLLHWDKNSKFFVVESTISSTGLQYGDAYTAVVKFVAEVLDENQVRFTVSGAVAAKLSNSLKHRVEEVGWHHIQSVYTLFAQNLEKLYGATCCSPRSMSLDLASDSAVHSPPPTFSRRESDESLDSAVSLTDSEENGNKKSLSPSVSFADETMKEAKMVQETDEAPISERSLSETFYATIQPYIGIIVVTLLVLLLAVFTNNLIQRTAVLREKLDVLDASLMPEAVAGSTTV